MGESRRIEIEEVEKTCNGESVGNEGSCACNDGDNSGGGGGGESGGAGNRESGEGCDGAGNREVGEGGGGDGDGAGNREVSEGSCGDGAGDREGGEGGDGDGAGNREASEGCGGNGDGAGNREGSCGDGTGDREKRGSGECDGNDNDAQDGATDIGLLRDEILAKDKACSELLDRLQRLMAEFDNYKKRTQKEKECIYDNAASDIIAAFLPVVDSIEGAAATAAAGPIKEGVNLIEKQVNDVMQKLKVEKIPGAGTQFDPKYHNAVMHVDDDQLEKNVVAEVYQAGYLYKDRVVRYSMVKVAN